MQRQSHRPIILTFLAVALMGGYNIWTISAYEPLSNALRLTALAVTFATVMIAPALSYFGSALAKRWLTVIAFALVIPAFGLGILLSWNGQGDRTHTRFLQAEVIEHKLTTIKSSPVYYLQVCMLETKDIVNIYTTREKFDQVQEGSIVGVPVKSGNLGIPWRIKGDGLVVRQPTVK